ncbi:hypothetical protein Ab1vBOLIVR5_gp115c [Agrobacterium phage OLIVR5]|uniref:Uncharacterized protein n=1 Tax=Agrobacterium phage OLIVR5 TaxID=2723773 RepID=A0A858MTB3_9CAUD|nr:hypothetical protein KNU99_gp115 [Agrobacterium phage OLIVR5]QIW87763.1 hypothetical protein Ab1vBOLIVR5_gp115c [Agrobacterium phage OLIVR5]
MARKLWRRRMGSRWISFRSSRRPTWNAWPSKRMA